MREKALRTTCTTSGLSELGYCSIHGPASNRASITWNMNSVSTEYSSAIKVLSYKYAAIFWAMNKDMEFIEESLEKQEPLTTLERLSVLQNNNDALFKVQTKVIQLIQDSNLDEQTITSWATYSDDIESITTQLASDADSLLYQLTDDSEANAEKELAISALEMTGKLYEHIGYARSQAGDYKKATQAWKRSADVASHLLARAKQQNDLEQQQFYSYQTATRLHKASYNWRLASSHTDKSTTPEMTPEAYY